MKMDIKSIEWDRSNRIEGQDWSKFYFCNKDVVSGTNGYSRKFRDEEVSMLCCNGKGVAHFKKRGMGFAEDA